MSEPTLRDEWRAIVWEAAVVGASQGVLPHDLRVRSEALFDRLAPTPPALDVDRLVRAIQSAQAEHWNDPDDTFAKAIAREYAALSLTPTDE